jgi:hypothetical protein
MKKKSSQRPKQTTTRKVYRQENNNNQKSILKRNIMRLRIKRKKWWTKSKSEGPVRYRFRAVLWKDYMRTLKSRGNREKCVDEKNEEWKSRDKNWNRKEWQPVRWFIFFSVSIFLFPNPSFLGPNINISYIKKWKNFTL